MIEPDWDVPYPCTCVIVLWWSAYKSIYPPANLHRYAKTTTNINRFQGKPWISTAMLFWYLSFQSKTVATGPQRSTTSRRVCRSARLWGGSAKCGSQRWLQMWRLGVFWWDRYPLVMTNIAIENGDLFSGITHWTWWFSIVILVYQRVNLI